MYFKVAIHNLDFATDFQYFIIAPIVDPVMGYPTLCLAFVIPIVLICLQMKRYRMYYPNESFGVWSLATNYESIKDYKHNIENPEKP